MRCMMTAPSSCARHAGTRAAIAMSKKHIRNVLEHTGLPLIQPHADLAPLASYTTLAHSETSAPCHASCSGKLQRTVMLPELYRMTFMAPVWLPGGQLNDAMLG